MTTCYCSLSQARELNQERLERSKTHFRLYSCSPPAGLEPSEEFIIELQRPPSSGGAGGGVGSKLRVVVSMPEGEHALGKTHMFGLSPGPQNLVFGGARGIQKAKV